ncbi:hypothetical protein [Clostridium sp. ZBS5]|nr:hypothetical protein [Clostridium sp. ZBS5]
MNKHLEYEVLFAPNTSVVFLLKPQRVLPSMEIILLLCMASLKN